MNKITKLLMTATAFSFLVATVAPVPTAWMPEVSAKDKDKNKKQSRQKSRGSKKSNSKKSDSGKKSNSSKKYKSREPEQRTKKAEQRPQPRGARESNRRRNVKQSANEKSAPKGYMKRRAMKSSEQDRTSTYKKKGSSPRKYNADKTAKVRNGSNKKSAQKYTPRKMPWRNAAKTEKVRGGSPKQRLDTNRTRPRKGTVASNERPMSTYQYANVNRKAGNSRHAYKQVEPRRITRRKPKRAGVDRTVTRNNKLDRREDHLDRREDRIDRREDRIEYREDRQRYRRYDRARYYHGLHWGVYSHYYDQPLNWYHGLPRYSYWRHSNHYWGGRMIYRPSVLYMQDSYWYGYPIGNGHHYDCDYGYNYQGAHYHPYGAPVHSAHEKIHDDDFAEEILAGVIGGLIIYSIID